MIYLVSIILLIALWLAIDHAIFKEPEGGYYQKDYDCHFCKDTGWMKSLQNSHGDMLFYGKYEPCPQHLRKSERWLRTTAEKP